MAKASLLGSFVVVEVLDKYHSLTAHNASLRELKNSPCTSADTYQVAVLVAAFL